MTTFAHISGGVVVAATIQHFIFKEELTPSTILFGALLGFLPDLDALFALLFGKWVPGGQMLSHHQYFTHTPIFYFFISSILWMVVDRKWAFTFLAITLTHLLMDSWSTDDGIMWFWPVHTEQYSIFPIDLHAGGIYGLNFYSRYIRTPRLILAEIIIMALGIITIIRFVLQRYFSEY